MAANDKKQSHPQVGDKVRFLGSRLSPVEDEIAKVQYVLKGSGLVLTLDELAHESFKCSEWDAAKAEGN